MEKKNLLLLPAEWMKNGMEKNLTYGNLERD
jgi:hypothetical protein